jgi:hypothetical protein
MYYILKILIVGGKNNAFKCMRSNGMDKTSHSEIKTDIFGKPFQTASK